ncbi:asparagine synthase (glutamine-hydrolysing) [Amycolatopsis marina]|uniref:Asparagine synthase (Glutamine-hydrolysing) n=2 Tax=Amycolatopsis marina TaxID=490629 RepID=A0A1I0XAQ9_9PSEU|nr:asparagine synthase (glutamine-hydrolysing) [Amycolatopsis marina]
MDPLEIAGGWVNGYDDVPFPSAAGDGPRRVLDRLLVRHLRRSPCLVAFSGGRDSSVVLAAAVAAARREGLPLPIPVTLTYPDAPKSNEAEWQHAVLDHLGIAERVTLTVHDEHDPIGPIAAPLLRRHGIVWSPNFAPTWRMMDLARGGVLLTGEGGDELFGLKRITPLTKSIKARGRVRPGVYQDVVRALAPARTRSHTALRQRYRRPWLRAPVEALLARRDAADAAAYALHAGRNAWQFTIRRCARRSYESIRVLGAEIDVEYVQMFAEPELVVSVATAAGFWGWSGRTATMRHLFDDLLPQAVFERGTKAVFTNAVFTEHAREFARGWTGGGVDPELVDPEALRANWLSHTPHAPSMALLQQAWLASDRAARSA